MTVRAIARSLPSAIAHPSPVVDALKRKPRHVEIKTGMTPPALLALACPLADDSQVLAPFGHALPLDRTRTPETCAPRAGR